jgi:hypothetical protein
MHEMLRRQLVEKEVQENEWWDRRGDSMRDVEQ